MWSRPERTSPSVSNFRPLMLLTQVKAGDLAVPYRMSELDILFGAVCRALPGPLEPLPPSGPTPRTVLEEILVEELSARPCMVSFSGGRDSSALLAVALEVARQHGLPEPVAFTLRYPGDTDAEESAWQQLVIDYLRPTPLLQAAWLASRA